MAKVRVELFAPPAYWRLSPEAREDYRCGPGRGILEILVPDALWCGFPATRPLSIQPACSIHDWMYSTAEATPEAKAEADQVFLNNLVRIVTAAGGPSWLRRMRLRRCRVYFDAVDRWGGPAFWDGKNRPEELALVSA